jgi:apurinic endonuclease APN1
MILNKDKTHKISKQSNKTKKSTKSKKTKKSTKLKLGCHISISPSILDGIKYGESIGGNALQLFMGNKLSFSLKQKTKLEPDECKTIKNYVSRNNITLFIHSPYVLNFCSYPSTSGRIQYQHANIQYDLKYGSLIGAKCVVLHIGFKTKLSEEEALHNLVSNIVKIAKHMPKNITLGLETSACRGSEFGCSIEELKLIWDGIHKDNKNIKNIKNIKNVGFIIDTAHIFVSGYDISTVSGIKNYLDTFDKMIGLKHILGFHINDSRYDVGDKKDEHRGIGKGKIYNSPEGLKALAYIKHLCNKKNIPMILETHSAGSPEKEESKEYEYEIDLIRKM